MIRTAAASVAAVAAVALSSSVAHAQPTVTEEEARQVAAVVVEELTKEDVVPYQAKLFSFIAGYHGDVAGFGELRAGFGKGKFKRSMTLPSVTMYRVELAVRGAYGRTDSIAASLLGGWGKVSYLGITLEAGVDAHLAPGDVAVGPIGSIGFRVGPVGLHTSVWTHVTGDESDSGIVVGLGFTKGDFMSPADVAKARAKERVKLELQQRGIPLPP
ncbi:MAG TPA: hypothetical protein VM261_21350 [Kofleriaceae bacterium]|nr:hypothetical protein [Kofleriaceae bacterium]